MSKGTIFIAGLVGGVIGGISLSSAAIANYVNRRGVMYTIRNSENGVTEDWICAFGTTPETSHFGFVVKKEHKEEKESDETESTETSKDNEQDSGTK